MSTSVLLFVFILFSFVRSGLAGENETKNIVFLKTHKCASSAIQNILMRYGYNHKLWFILPPKANYLQKYKLFNSSLVPQLPQNESYNILAHHSRFNFNEMKKVMPIKPAFVTILRNPVDHFESLFGYYNIHKYFKVDINHLRDRKKLKSRIFGKFGFNQMLYDLGFDAVGKSVQQVDDYIRRLDSQFDLVMISDRMNESLVLLKTLLNWDTEDVAVFTINSRKKTVPLLDTTIRLIQDLNWADQRLYDYFSNKFEKLVQHFGQWRMMREVSELRSTINKLYDVCHDEEQEEEGTCTLLNMKELPFTEKLRQEQKIRLKKL